MRISMVDEVNVLSLSFSSYLHIGDSYCINAKSKALAVKREYPRYFGNEGSFAAYPIFTMNTPTPVITEKINTQISNVNPNIIVNNISVKGVSSSSILQVGSSNSIFAEARIKHIRQLMGSTSSNKLDE